MPNTGGSAMSSPAPSSSAPTVHLAPIIKTNHAQAMALEMNMIASLSNDAADSPYPTSATSPLPSTSAFSPAAPSPMMAVAAGGGAGAGAAGRHTKSASSGANGSLAVSPQFPSRGVGAASPAAQRRLSEVKHGGNSGMGVGAGSSASPLAVAGLLAPNASHVLYTFPPSAAADERTVDGTAEHDGEKDAAKRQRQQQKRDGESPERFASPSSPSLLQPLNLAQSSSQAYDGAAAPLSPECSASLSPALLSPSPMGRLASLDGLAQPPPWFSSTDREPAVSHARPSQAQPLLSSPSSSSWERAASASPAIAPALSNDVNGSSSLLTSAPLPSSSLSAAPGSSGAFKAGPRKRLMIAPASSGLSSCLPCLPCLPPAAAASSSVPAKSGKSSASSASTSLRSRFRWPGRRRAPLHRRVGDGTSASCLSDLVTCNPCRLSFRFTLVLLCVLQVVISVGIVWYLGYSNSTDLIGTLSNQLRQTALTEITGQMHDQLVRPLMAVNQLEYNMRRNLPQFGSLPTLTNVTGLYADLSFIVFNFPQISTASCSASDNSAIAAINISAYLAAGASPDTTNGVTSGFAYSFQDVGTTFSTYHLPPRKPASLDPWSPQPDYNETSTLADLGAYWYTVSPNTPSTRPAYLAALRSPGDFVWSPVFQLLRSTNASIGQVNESTIAAAKAYVTPSGSVGFVCSASMFMSRLGDLLRSLSIAYGPNGLALVLDNLGVPLACSDNSIMIATSSSPQQPLYFFPDDRLQAISAPLLSHGLFPPLDNWTSPTGDFAFGGVFFQNNPAFDAVPITFQGSAYHLQATRLNTTGLDWIIVVVTKDTDFDGDLNAHEIEVGLLSMMVLILAILVMVVVTQCLNRPLTLVVRYMSAVAKMGRKRHAADKGQQPLGGSGDAPNAPPTLSRSAEQLRQLEAIYAQWRAAVALSFDDEELEISRSRDSRSAARSHLSTDRHAPAAALGGNNGDDGGEGTFGGKGDSADDPTSDSRGAAPSPAPRKSAWWTRLIDKSAVCLMREVEDMQLTFHSMLYQLTRMTAEVESTNEAKRHFVRYIFHEVRVPLNAVMLGLADLRSSCGSASSGPVEWTEEQRDVLDIVHEQSQVVGRILNDVLSLHKIEDGALTLQYAPFSLESMILSTMQSFQPGIHDKQIHYTAQLQTVQHFVFAERTVDELRGAPQVDVVGDKYRLRQVLANFLSNSIKFTPHLGNVHVSLQILPVTPVQHTQHLAPPPQQQPGGGLQPSDSFSSSNGALSDRDSHAIDMPGVAARSSPSSAPGAASALPWPARAPTSAVFRIAVRDSGVGVSADNQKKLFSPYMQILPGELQKGAGTGLGLSIAQNLIRIHGGEIGHVTPEDGVGSEFYMEVPMRMQYRGVSRPGHKGSDGATPSGSVRAVLDGDEKRDDGAAATGEAQQQNDVEDDDEDDDLVIGALPLNEERQEEDAIIREITDLQQQQQRLSASPSTELTSALYVSRPNVTSPDSSIRVLTQQRLHAAHMRQSSHTASAAFAASPSLLHSSRRLVALARVPVPGRDAHEDGRTGDESSAASSAYSSGSRSVSLVMNDAHGPSASPLLTYKRSPLMPGRKIPGAGSVGSAHSVLRQAGEKDNAEPDGTSPLCSHDRSGADSADSGPDDADLLLRPRPPAAATAAGVSVLHTPLLQAATSQSLPSPPHGASSHSAHPSLGSASMRRGTTVEAITPPNRGSLNALGPAPTTPPSRSDLYITLATYGQTKSGGLSSTTSAQPAFSPALRLTATNAASSSSTLSSGHASSRALQSAQLGGTGEEDGGKAEALRQRPELEDTTMESRKTLDSPALTPPLQSASFSAADRGASDPTSSTTSSGTQSSLSSISSSPPPPSQSVEAARQQRAQIDGDSHTRVSPHNSHPPLPDATTVPRTASSSSSQSGTAFPDSPSFQPTSPSREDGSAPAAGAVHRSPPALTSPASTVPAPPPLRVLVAEDSVPNLKLLLVLLRKMRVDCKGVENGQLAVDEFKAWREAQLRGDASVPLPYDVLLIDGNMPVLGGIAATRLLRQMAVPIPIFAVTGNAMAEDTDEFLRAGANSPVLTKPVQQKELRKIIEAQQLARRKEWRAAHTPAR